MNNIQVHLKRRPSGMPVLADFTLCESPLPQLADGEVLVRNLYLSVDPALRPRMDPVSPYGGALALDQLVPSSAIGVVLASRSSACPVGTHVYGFFGWQLLCATAGAGLRHIDPARAPLPKWMSVLGLSAFTAYIGLREFGRARPGETVVVSAASGATGAIAGQLARIAGARAVGIAGGAQKNRYVTGTLGFDACIDYKAPDFERQLAAACPDGIDIDFENVGGAVLGAILPRMNECGRVIVCGLVAEYGRAGVPGPNLWPAVYNSLSIQGFRASRYFQHIPEFIEQALAWHAEGRLVHSEFIAHGIEQAPATFIAMLGGQHLGKAMVSLG